MSTPITNNNHNSHKPYRILLADTQAIIIDVQKAFAPHIHEMDALANKLTILIQGLQTLEVPIMLNEQYPKGLGVTIDAITEVLDEDNKQVFEKSEFSVCDAEHSWAQLEKRQRNNVLICGIEAHVCVQQTVMDLLTQGMQPVLIEDAISSRNLHDKNIAVARMRQAGAVVTTVEAILFELCRSSRHPAFKTISNLVK